MIYKTIQKLKIIIVRFYIQIISVGILNLYIYMYNVYLSNLDSDPNHCHYYYFFEKNVRIDFWFLAGGEIFFLPLAVPDAAAPPLSIWLDCDCDAVSWDDAGLALSSSEQLYSTVSTTVSIIIIMYVIDMCI